MCLCFVSLQKFAGHMNSEFPKLTKHEQRLVYVAAEFIATGINEVCCWALNRAVVGGAYQMVSTPLSEAFADFFEKDVGERWEFSPEYPDENVPKNERIQALCLFAEVCGPQ